MRFKGGSGEGGSAVSVELKVTKRVKNGPLRPATRATDDLQRTALGTGTGESLAAVGRTENRGGEYTA